MIRAVFFDIDGTLTSRHDKKIPASCKQAIAKLKEQGIYVGIATGRHTIEMSEENLLEDLTFDGYVTLNGQLCYENGNLKHQLALNKQDVFKVMEISQAQQIPVLFIEENKMYINRVDERVIAAQKAIHTAIPPVQSVTASNLGNLYQLCIYPSNQQVQLFSSLKHTAMTQWHQDAYDLIPKQGSKTEGIRQLLKSHHISLDEVLCFGDGDNDADMLEKCGIGIAMGDASNKAKQAAQIITDASFEDGIFNALVRLGLIEAV